MSRMTVVQVGCGVVGTAYASAYRHFGNQVHAVDVNESRVDVLRGMGIAAYTPDQTPKDLDPHLIMISVNTPLLHESQRLDLKYLKSAMTGSVATLVTNAKNMPVVVVRSTVPPGSTEGILLDLLTEATGKQEGRDFHIAYQPEFLRAKSAEDDALHPWQVVIGARSDFAYSVLRSFYQGCIDTDRIVEMPIKECELHKLAHNFFNALKISYANLVWLMGNQLGVDAEKVLQVVAQTAEGVRNPKYGMTPGAPYGGTCLPKDTPEIAGVARDLGVCDGLPMAATCINDTLHELARAGLAQHAKIAGHNWVPGTALK